ncbi:hypothetical protein BDZ90DRAFT_170219 [Jaminaea rosea]|uniref:Uncharacterized protein n=1 Tax=Jaminaea rosea TaxID=1569628 RepID=A0A316UQY1_9BASI|nr:hypothetical protein BDZ90DRAFT_170219 [Jaminaea rosea]PWN27717.1 hypothetical protein BDZ90DRAFT_170219 [Jaminaea rosea]
MRGWLDWLLVLYGKRHGASAGCDRGAIDIATDQRTTKRGWRSRVVQLGHGTP